MGSAMMVPLRDIEDGNAKNTFRTRGFHLTHPLQGTRANIRTNLKLLETNRLSAGHFATGNMGLDTFTSFHAVSFESRRLRR